MAMYAIKIGWDDLSGDRWTAFYTRNRVSFKTAIEQAFKDFDSIFREDPKVYTRRTVSVTAGDSKNFPSGIDYDNCHVVGNARPSGRIHLLCEDGRTQLYMMESTKDRHIVGVSDWMCWDENPKSHMVPYLLGNYETRYY